MPRFSANLTMMFQEHLFMERFAAAAKAGFKAVEFMFPYDYEVADLKRQLVDNDLALVLFNLPAGNWAAGDRGIAVDPRRAGEFREGVAKAVAYAVELDVPVLNCLVGKKIAEIPEEEQRQAMIQNLQFASDALMKAGKRLVVEPLNYRDMPGFFLNTTGQVFTVLDEVARDNAFLQYDLYHAQRVEGELIGTLEKNLSRMGHIQIADNPGRHQPGTGEINFTGVFKAIDQCGYSGYVGLEYIPLGSTLDSLSWMNEYGYSLSC